MRIDVRAAISLVVVPSFWININHIVLELRWYIDIRASLLPFNAVCKNPGTHTARRTSFPRPPFSTSSPRAPDAAPSPTHGSRVYAR